MQNIVIIGAGAIGTALGNALAVRADLNVTLLSIEKEVVDSISRFHINQKYFPNIRLESRLNATLDNNVLQHAEIVFIAVPSSVIIKYLTEIKPYIPANAVLINLAKGFGFEKRLIPDCLSEMFPFNKVCVLKGPSFAREIINNSPTAFTLAAKEIDTCDALEPLFENTILFVDKSVDVVGVEVLSLLKNIYAILIGIVDAHFDTANLRFMMFTRAFSEMRTLLKHFGGKEETMFNYCGIGDFGLTSLNDLSRNRTLGLLIGKGFFTETISNKVVLEGRVAMRIMLEKLKETRFPENEYRMMIQLDKVFTGVNDISGFVDKLINNRD